MTEYRDSIAEVIFDESRISSAIDAMAAAIARDFSGEPILVVGVLKGALFVFTDLVRAIARQPNGPSDLSVETIWASSYGNATRSSGEVHLREDVTGSIRGRNVLLVDDIVDNGLTMQYLRELLVQRAPARLRTAALLEKPERRLVNVRLDYVGLRCPNAFVVGYGLDYRELYRNLPIIARLKPESFAPEN
uniref:hypoxanthine phosphoribosyltransferase n=1 Tax=mine drainage metagenome TaxID=410659 RepID=E6PID4_9ZZZZ